MRVIDFIFYKKSVVALFILVAIVTGSQSYLNGVKRGVPTTKSIFTKYNNYIIFEESFKHLKNNQDLYIAYPDEHWDLYKYTPTFSVFFGFFSLFPDWFGLILWNLVNSLVFLIAVFLLPYITDKQKIAILFLSFIEMHISILNEQSNGLMVGLILLTYVFLEKEHYFAATFMLVFSIYIKLFSVIGFVLFLFYPKKIKLTLYTLFWVVALFLVPLLLIDINQYQFLIGSYLNMLGQDHSTSYGLSVLGFLNSWFGLSILNMHLTVIGGLLFLLPLISFKCYNMQIFRMLYVSSLLIWVVIFNHKAESPTFIIAIAGVGIWYFASEARKTVKGILLALVVVFTSMSATDLFPKVIRNELFEPYMVKVIPCILVWLFVTYELMMCRNKVNLTKS